MIIAIDFDRTICDSRKRQLGPPMPGAGRALRKLKADGHYIIIHSVYATKNPEGTKQWLETFNMPYDEIAPKVVADVYVDDHGMHFDTWANVLDKIEDEAHTLFNQEDWK